MAINVSITLNDTARAFYGFGPYIIVNGSNTTVDLSLFNNAELHNLVSSVNGGELTVSTFTPAQFAAYVGGVVASQSSLIASSGSVGPTVLATALTGFVSGAGTVAATDTVLSAFDKINGNVALKAPLASPTFTGTVTTTVPVLTGATVGTTAPAAGAGSALPATPAGYVTININGAAHQIAIY